MSVESWPAKTTWSHPPMTEMRWQWLGHSNWAHLIETEERPVMGCGWSLPVLISWWDRSTSDVDNVCVSSCDELRILLIVKIKQEECVFYHSVRAFVCVLVCVCFHHCLCLFTKSKFTRIPWKEVPSQRSTWAGQGSELKTSLREPQELCSLSMKRYLNNINYNKDGKRASSFL